MGSEHVVRRVRRCEDSGDARDVIAVLTLLQYRDDVDVQAECLRVLGKSRRTGARTHVLMIMCDRGRGARHEHVLWHEARFRVLGA